MLKLQSKKLVNIYIINRFFHWFIIGMIIPIIALYQIEKGLDLFQIGITGGFYSGTILLLELPTGALADEMGRKNIYLISQIFSVNVPL